jgi:hypothetical protein
VCILVVSALHCPATQSKVLGLITDRARATRPLVRRACRSSGDAASLDEVAIRAVQPKLGQDVVRRYLQQPELGHVRQRWAHGRQRPARGERAAAPQPKLREAATAISQLGWT